MRVPLILALLLAFVGVTAQTAIRHPSTLRTPDEIGQKIQVYYENPMSACTPPGH